MCDALDLSVCRTHSLRGIKMRTFIFHKLNLIAVVYSFMILLPSIINADIVFLSDRDAGIQTRANDVYRMSDSGNNIRRLTTDLLFKSHPVFSPDGSQIAFAVEIVKPGGKPWEPQQTVELFIMNANGSSAIQLTNYKHICTQPSWSPDGERLAFASTHEHKLEIYVMDTITGDITQLTNARAEVGGTASDPNWSPDGEKIAYSLVLPGEGRHIYIIDVNGKNPRALVKDRKLEVGISVFDTRAKWHPDSENILHRSSAFKVEQKGNVQFLKTVGLTKLVIRRENDRSSTVLKIPENLEVGGGSWAENGRAVIFPAAVKLENGVENADIYKYDLSTHQVTNISNHTAMDSLPNWTEATFSVSDINFITTQWAQIKK